MMQDFYRPSEYPSYIDGKPFLAGILEGRYAEGNKIDSGYQVYNDRKCEKPLTQSRNLTPSSILSSDSR